MDNLTHSLFGAVLAKSGISKRHGRSGTALLVVASNVCDVDLALHFTHGEASAWMRRTYTHCAGGGPLVAVALALAWWLGTKRRMPLGAAFGLSLLGVAGHVFLDLLNSYGVVALWPFSSQRYELAWAYIIDLAMLAILTAPFLARRLLAGRVAEAVLHRVALGAFALYLACCAAGRTRAQRLLQDELAREAAHADFTYVFPEALGPHRWRAVAREGDRWRVWLVHVLDGRVEPVREVTTAADDPRVVALRATPRGQAIERFFKAPVWTVDEARGVATCSDLRFSSAVISRGRGPFTYEFPLAR